MAINYTWEFKSIKVKPTSDNLSDVVYSFDWTRTAKDDSYSASVSGIIVLPEPDPKNFKKFTDLKKEDMENWAEKFAYYPTSEIVTDKLAAIDEVLLQQINNQKNPPLVNKSAPWDKQSEVISN